MKILGVTISSKLSVSEHVQQAVSRCAQSLHVLTSRGINDNHHTAGLQVGRTRRDDVCYQCMVRLHYGGRQTASAGVCLPNCLRWSLPSRLTARTCSSRSHRRRRRIGFQSNKHHVLRENHQRQIWTLQRKTQLHAGHSSHQILTSEILLRGFLYKHIY